VGSMYLLPSVTELFLAQPPIYSTTGRGAPMQLVVADAIFVAEAMRYAIEDGGWGCAD
jgi:hypothetical protein